MALRGERTPFTTLVKEIVARRDLCVTLARKDFFVRYRRATFGMLWAIALPAVQAVVLSTVLRRVARLHVPHYPAFIFSGVVVWTYASATIGAGVTSIVDGSALSSRIYFPRAILPVVTCLSNAFALAISASVALVFGWASGAGVGPHNLLLVPAILLVVMFAAGMALVLSALHVYYRDTTFFVQALLLIWFYSTPIFYPLGLLHGSVHTILEINPLTGAVGLFHAAIVGQGVPGICYTSTLTWTFGLLVIAAFLHTRYDRSFADLL